MALDELYTLPIRIGGVGPVHVISGSLTSSTDEIIYTPAADKCAFLVGQLFSETDATNITYKSGSDTIVTVELATNQGIYDKVSEGIITASEMGAVLIANPSVSVSSAVFYVIEAKSLVFE